MEQKLQKNSTGNKARMQRYRSTHRRIDYVPCPEALAAIEMHKGLDNCLAGVLDQLILAGNKALPEMSGSK